MVRTSLTLNLMQRIIEAQEKREAKEKRADEMI